MSYAGKTDWELNDLVMPEDMNRIEQGILDNDKLLYLIKTIFPAISSSNVFTVTISSGIISSMSDLIGVPLKIKAEADSSSAVRLQINSFGAYSLKKPNGNDVTNLKANGIYTVVWNGVNFQLLGEGGEYGTATPAEVLKGYTIGTEEGIKTGTLELTGNATAADTLAGKTFYNTNAKVKETGTMTNRGAWNGTITLTSSTSGTVTIPSGFHSGSGKVTATVDDADLIASNIRSGKNILGVTGTLIEATGNANTGDVLSGKTFSKAGSAGLTGTMSNHGAKVITPSTVNQAIPAGYHNGQGYVVGSPNLIPANIKKGVNIFGVIGTLGTQITVQPVSFSTTLTVPKRTGTGNNKSHSFDTTIITLPSDFKMFIYKSDSFSSSGVTMSAPYTGSSDYSWARLYFGNYLVGGASLNGNQEKSLFDLIFAIRLPDGTTKYLVTHTDPNDSSKDNFASDEYDEFIPEGDFKSASINWADPAIRIDSSIYDNTSGPTSFNIKFNGILYIIQ